jgi:predicted aspartyl protease
VVITVAPYPSIETEALVDTGYTGFVVVPVGSLPTADAPHRVTLRLADGTPLTAPAYRGELVIGATCLASVLVTALGDSTIIGLQVLRSFTLTLDHGREIALQP